MTYKYTVRFKASAQKAFDKLDPQTRVRVAKAIAGLADNPRPHGYVKLEGETDKYRIRAGDYRVIYSIRDGELVVLVLDIDHRSKVYNK